MAKNTKRIIILNVKDELESCVTTYPECIKGIKRDADDTSWMGIAQLRAHKARSAIKLTAEEKEAIKDLCVDTDNEVIINPFSGEKVELTPMAVAIYDCLKGAELLAAKNPEDERNIDLFYICKDIFAKNWPKEYMQLID